MRTSSVPRYGQVACTLAGLVIGKMYTIMAEKAAAVIKCFYSIRFSCSFKTNLAAAEARLFFLCSLGREEFLFPPELLVTGIRVFFFLFLKLDPLFKSRPFLRLLFTAQF